VRVVIALGGNALLRRGESLDAEVQQRNVRRAADAVADVARAHQVVVTHGNGPQVGLLALQSAALAGARPWPLDVLGAETEGMIGYLVELELRNRLPGRAVATLLTQVEVAAGDPAFARPSKPIGPVYTRAEAERLAAERGWRVAPDGPGFRRVVASPEPLRLVELESIRLLLEAGTLVVCAGGGGIPVVSDASMCHRGVEAVVDKDLAAALLAAELGCDALLMLTDVDAVYEGWRTPEARPLRAAAPGALRARAFEPGTMGPKVEAACRFAERTAGFAAIGRLEDAAALLAGAAGTRVAREETALADC
jgi:carbamate kinase